MSDDPAPPETERFDYFMVRLHRTASQPDRLSGQVERLGTGERWRFDTSEQLVRLVGAGPAQPSQEVLTHDGDPVRSRSTESSLEDGT